MLDSNPSACLVLTTAASRGQAAQMGQKLVEERLAACATVISGAESIYRWEGKIDRAEEPLLLLKTETERLEDLEARLLALQAYTTPEFLVLKVDAGSQAYLQWLGECVRR